MHTDNLIATLRNWPHFPLFLRSVEGIPGGMTGRSLMSKGTEARKRYRPRDSRCIQGSMSITGLWTPLLQKGPMCIQEKTATDQNPVSAEGRTSLRSDLPSDEPSSTNASPRGAFSGRSCRDRAVNELTHRSRVVLEELGALWKGQQGCSSGKAPPCVRDVLKNHPDCPRSFLCAKGMN